jgi:UrcA family protein
MTFFKTLAVATALIASTVSTAAIAEEKSIEVRYSDLDLSTAKGQKALESRVARAAKLVCGDRSGQMPLWEQTAISNCTAKAKGEALASFKAGSPIQLAAR